MVLGFEVDSENPNPRPMRADVTIYPFRRGCRVRNPFFIGWFSTAVFLLILHAWSRWR